MIKKIKSDTMQTLICPNCGKETKKSDFVDNMCKTCYYVDKKLFDIKLKDVFVCKSCGRLKTDFFWHPFSEDTLEKLILDKLKSDYELKLNKFDITYFKKKMQIDLDFTIDKENFQDSVMISPKYQYCSDCYKKISDYFQTTVQVRGFNFDLATDKEFKRYQKLAEKEEIKKGNFGSYLQKSEKVNNGKDYFFGSKGVGQAFIKEIKARHDVEVKLSFKLVGMLPGGKEKIRNTFLVRKKEPKPKENTEYQK